MLSLAQRRIGWCETMLNLENQKAVIVQFFGRRPLRRGALRAAVGKKENRGNRDYDWPWPRAGRRDPYICNSVPSSGS